MSNDIVFIDCFSGSAYDLKPRQRGNIKTVLKVLSADPNVSVWDMDNGTRYPLWKTIKKLEDLGYVKSVERPYPWLKYEVTDAGRKFLEADKIKNNLEMNFVQNR